MIDVIILFLKALRDRVDLMVIMIIKICVESHRCVIRQTKLLVAE